MVALGLLLLHCHSSDKSSIFQETLWVWEWELLGQGQGQVLALGVEAGGVLCPSLPTRCSPGPRKGIIPVLQAEEGFWKCFPAVVTFSSSVFPRTRICQEIFLGR